LRPGDNYPGYALSQDFPPLPGRRIVDDYIDAGAHKSKKQTEYFKENPYGLIKQLI
jgi:hypothetical protein